MVGLRPIIRGKVRKRPREDGQDETEARATGEQGSDLSEAQEMEAEATPGEASAFLAQEVRSSVIWPWQVAAAASGETGRRVVHRLAVGCRTLSIHEIPMVAVCEVVARAMAADSLGL